MKYKNKTLIFCRDENSTKEECKKLNIQGSFEITNDEDVLKKFL